MTAEAVWRLFAGKGGVGKTTCAAASAVAAAERGARVLLVSTDPAHSLGDALDLKLGPTPKRVPLGARAKGTLHACELDADAALDRFIDERKEALRAAALRGTYLDKGEVDQLLRLSLPGVDELVGLLEVDRLAGEGDLDEVVVDTAPCGHTLRLLATPALLERLSQVIEGLQARHRALAAAFGVPRRDATDRLIEELAGLGAALHARLRDPDRCSLSWVTLPEALAVEETADGLRALEEAGIPVEALVVNRLAAPPRGRCTTCTARVAAERAALRPLGPWLSDRALHVVPALPAEPRGVAALRGVARALEAPARLARHRATGAPPKAPRAAPTRGAPASRPAAPAWLGALVPDGVRLLLVAGKGGVGKTSSASAVALHAAARDPAGRVLLLSVDPAHSLGDALDLPLDDRELPVAGAPRGLRARELDAAARLREQRAAWLAAVDGLFDCFARMPGDGRLSVDAGLDRKALRDLVDLAPPGVDELLAVLAVVEALGLDSGAGAPYDLVVLDTAPTGHAIRLLEMPARVRAWVKALLELLLRWRQVVGLGALAEELTRTARRLRLLEELLRDPARTRCLVVARAADLPRLETARALTALARLGLRAGAVLVNALTPPGCARCRRAAKAEAAAVGALRRDAAFARAGCAMIRAGARVPPPRGPRALSSWAMDWTLDEAAPARRKAARPAGAR